MPTRALNEHFGAISLIFGFLSYIILFTATQPTLKPSYVVHLAARSIQRGYSYSILMCRGNKVLLGPVSSMKKQKYQVFSRFFGFYSCFSRFCSFPLEIWIGRNLKHVFESGESDFGVKNAQKYHLGGPQRPCMSILGDFWLLRLF